MPKYYLLDENKNLVEGFDKEGFLALLEQAIEDGSLENIDENSAVASKLRSVINGTTHHIEFVTQAQYNQLEHDGELVENTYYFITDDTTEESLETAINGLNTRLAEAEQRLDDLGFKEGAFIVSGISPEFIITNSLVKQGKRVIANLVISNTSPSYLNTGKVEIPSGFIPKASMQYARQVFLINDILSLAFGLENLGEQNGTTLPMSTLFDFDLYYQQASQDIGRLMLVNVVWEVD